MKKISIQPWGFPFPMKPQLSQPFWVVAVARALPSSLAELGEMPLQQETQDL